MPENDKTNSAPIASVVMPWHDCPTCPKCKLPVAVVGAPETLYCPACGNAWHGSSSEIEQAKKADAAWEMKKTESA